MNNIEFNAGPLGYQGPLNYEETFPLLGIPVTFRSNHRLVIERAITTFGHWNQLSKVRYKRDSNLIVDIVIQNSDNKAATNKYDFFQQVHGDTYLASHGKNLLSAHKSSGKAKAFITSDLLGNESAFAWFVLEGLALFLATSSCRIPFHAASVTKKGKSIAFMGKSGAGKSSLAYGCLRRGFNLLSEDVIYVGMESNYRIWGNATKIHLLPESVRLFPELNGHEPKLHPNGKLKITIPLTEINNSVPALQVPSITVCLIEPDHGNRESSIEPISFEQVSEAMISTLEPGFDLFSEQLPAALERLLSRQAYRLTVGYDLDATTDLLMNLV